MSAMSDLLSDTVNDTNSTFKKLFDDIIERTPIDTGATRGNYKLEHTSFDKFDTNWALIKPKEMKKFLLKDKLELSNSTPYLEKLEQGSSKQAPLGVFMITLMDFKRTLRRTQNGL